MSDNKELVKFSGINEKKPILSVALKLLSVRDRSVKDMKNALMKKSYEKDEIEAVLQQLIEEGYLNDHRTANFWANCLFDTGQYGVYGISRKLIERGIPEDLSLCASNEVYEGNDEYEFAMVIAEKKASGIRDKKKAERVISNYLMRHGFSSSTIYRVVKSIGSEEFFDVT